MRSSNACLWMVVLAALLAGCATGSRICANGCAVAVWPPDDLRFQADGMPDLSMLLGNRVTEAIDGRGQYTVVERQQLELVLAELNLGSSALADPATRLKIGRIAGARLMVFGGYQVINGRMRIDLRLVDVSTAAIIATAAETAAAADINGWLEAAGAAAADLFKPLE